MRHWKKHYIVELCEAEWHHTVCRLFCYQKTYILGIHNNNICHKSLVKDGGGYSPQTCRLVFGLPNNVFGKPTTCNNVKYLVISLFAT